MKKPSAPFLSLTIIYVIPVFLAVTTPVFASTAATSVSTDLKVKSSGVYADALNKLNDDTPLIPLKSIERISPS